LRLHNPSSIIITSVAALRRNARAIQKGRSTEVAEDTLEALEVSLRTVWNGQSGNSTQDFFGRASYHLFIGHMPITAVLVTGLNLRQGSVFVFLAAVIVALALSLGLVPLERNMNVMRQRIAKMSKPSGEEPTQGHDPSEHQPADVSLPARPSSSTPIRAGLKVAL
jgi:hypothetical protein